MTEQPTPSGSEPTTGIDTYTVQIRSELFPGVVDHLIKTHLGALAADLAEITGAGDWQVTFANAAGQTLAQHQSEHADALFD